MAPDRPHRAAVAVAAVWQGSAMPAAPPALELAWDQVVGWRLRRHHLDERAPGGDLLAVVAEIAGLHAQIMSSAQLGLPAQARRFARAAVLRPQRRAARALHAGCRRGTATRARRPRCWRRPGATCAPAGWSRARTTPAGGGCWRRRVAGC